MYYKNEITLEPKENARQEIPIMSLIWEMFITLTASFLFLSSAGEMLTTLFPDRKIPTFFILASFLSTIPSIFFGTLLAKSMPVYQKKLHFGICVFYLVSLSSLFLFYHETLFEGGAGLLELYLKQLNHYYSNAYYTLFLTVHGDSETGSLQTALLLWIILFFSIITLYGELTQKKFLMASFPVLLFIMLLLTGKSPDYTALFYGFSGMILISFHGWYGEGRGQCRLSGKHQSIKTVYMAVAAFLMLCLLAVGLPLISKSLFHDTSKNLLAYSPQARKFQETMERQFETSLSSFTSGAKEVVSNRTPWYTGRKIMDVTIHGKVPSGNQYFRGFYGTNYDHSIWTTEETNFTDACEEAGYSEEELSPFLALSSKSYFNHMKTEETLYWLKGMADSAEITITCHDNKKGCLHLPYLIKGGKSTKKASFKQDVSFDKVSSQKEYHFSIWRPYNLLNVKPPEDYNVLYEHSDRKEAEWLNWYDRYVRKYYLNSSSEPLPCIARIAEEINSTLNIEESLEDTLGEDQQIQTENTDTALLNRETLKRANLVASYLKQNVYSLHLDSSIDGMDPVEYFLLKSHEGFCEHFACAGVLILRELGVPARYATGYMVHQDEWKKQKNGNYKAQILDSDAHAWAEVYLDQLGWVPIEMTPGMNSGATDPTRKQNEKNKNTGTATSVPINQAAKKTPKGTKAKSKKMPKTSFFPTGKNGTGTNNSGNNRSVHQLLKITFTITGIISLCFIILFIIRLQERKNENKLFDELHKKQNRKAVQRMNRLIYRNLCRSQHIKNKHLTDNEYHELLKETYPQAEKETLERFINLVQKASFSKDDISFEDAAFCHELYQKSLGK